MPHFSKPENGTLAAPAAYAAAAVVISADGETFGGGDGGGEAEKVREKNTEWAN